MVGIIFFVIVLVISHTLFIDVIKFDILPTEKTKGIIEKSNLNAALEGDYYECLVRYEYNNNIEYTSQILGVNENRKYLIRDSVELVISKKYPEKVSQGGSSLRILKLFDVIALIAFALWVMISKRF